MRDRGDSLLLHFAQSCRNHISRKSLKLLAQISVILVLDVLDYAERDRKMGGHPTVKTITRAVAVRAIQQHVQNHFLLIALVGVFSVGTPPFIKILAAEQQYQATVLAPSTRNIALSGRLAVQMSQAVSKKPRQEVPVRGGASSEKCTVVWRVPR